MTADRADEPDVPPRERTRAGIGRTAPLDVVRRGAEMLAPCWLELPAPHPRLMGFASAVTGAGAGVLVLGPIAADRLAADTLGPVVVRSAAPEAPFTLHAAAASRLGPHEIGVALADARLVPRRRRAAPRRNPDVRDPLMLVLPSGLDGVDVQVFPIVDVGRDACAVDAVVPLEPGRLLDPVEVVGMRRPLRIASATVREVVPWVSHRGELRFRCRLAFGRPGRPPAEAADDLLTDPDRTRRVLELAAMVERSAWLSDGDGARLEGRMLALEGHRLELRVAAGPARLRVGGTVRFGFELFAVSYEGDARVLAAHEGRHELALPLVLRRRRRRRKPRVEIPEREGVTLSFYNAAAGEHCERRVVDASFGGVCFAADPRRDVLWKGLPLEQATLRWRGRQVRLGEIEVRSVGGGRGDSIPCHAEMRSSPELADDAVLVDLLATLGHPDLLVHDGDNYRDVLATYDAAGLLGEFMKRNLRPVAPAAAVNWRRLHRAPIPVVRTIMHPVQGPPDATISALRAWDRTWLIQHFGALSADGFRWSGELQAATMDWIIPRPDGDYLLFFVHSKNARMSSFYERFIELTGTPEATSRSTASLWTLPAAASAPRRRAAGRGVDRVPAQDGLARLVARAADAHFGAMVADALAMHVGELELPECRRRFAEASLHRARVAEVVRVRGRPRVALLHEEMSPGLNLTWMQHASWVIPIGDREIDARAVDAVCRALRDRPPPSLAGDRFALLPPQVDGAPLAEDGWEHLLDANVFVMNRAGLHRFYHYVADRYGEVGVRKAKKDAREASRRAEATERAG